VTYARSKQTIFINTLILKWVAFGFVRSVIRGGTNMLSDIILIIGYGCLSYFFGLGMGWLRWGNTDEDKEKNR